MRLQRDLGHLGDQPADRKAVRANRQVLMRERVLQLDSIHDGEYPLQERLGNLEADKIVILLRGVLRALNGVETEFCLQVRCLVLRIGVTGPGRRAWLRGADFLLRQEPERMTMKVTAKKKMTRMGLRTAIPE
jgi:hypothetical protein